MSLVLVERLSENDTNVADIAGSYSENPTDALGGQPQQQNINPPMICTNKRTRKKSNRRTRTKKELFTRRKKSKPTCSDNEHPLGKLSRNSSSELDLSTSLPFTRCRIVLRLEDDDDGTPNGWVKEGDRFVFYDSITSREQQEMAVSLREPPGQHSKLKGSESEDTVPTGRRYRCPYCFISFSQAGDLITHLSIHRNKGNARKQGQQTGSRKLEQESNKTYQTKTVRVQGSSGIWDGTIKEPNVSGGNVNQDTPISENIEVVKSNGQISRYLCKLCGKLYIQRGHIGDHIRKVHLLEKRYNCTKCPKSYYSKSEFQTHLFRHSGIKSFKCTTCSIAFYQRGHLNCHIKRVHKNRS